MLFTLCGSTALSLLQFLAAGFANSGFSRSFSFVFRFSTDMLRMAKERAFGVPMSTQIFLARVMPV